MSEVDPRLVPLPYDDEEVTITYFSGENPHIIELNTSFKCMRNRMLESGCEKLEDLNEFNRTGILCAYLQDITSRGSSIEKVEVHDIERRYEAAHRAYLSSRVKSANSP